MNTQVTTISKGQRISFNSQFEKGNGLWEVYNFNAGSIFLARVMKNGKLGKPNAENLMCVERAIIDVAFSVGTATKVN